MILTIDVTGKDFQVTTNPAPKVDQQGVQRPHKESGLPMWSTELVVIDGSGGEIIKVSTHGKAPDVEVGDVVEVVDLVALPWFSNGRSGIAYKASAVQSVED